MALQKLVDGKLVDLSASEEQERYEEIIRTEAQLPSGATEAQKIRAAVYHYDWRKDDAWVGKDAATLSSEIQDQKIMRPLRLGEMWRLALAKATATEKANMMADARESRKISAEIDRLVTALQNGDRYDAEDNITTLPGVANEETRTHAKAVIADRAMSVIDLVCEINGVDLPADMSATAVETALGDAGYTWDGSKWVSA